MVLRVPAASWLGITYHESLFGSAAALRPIGHLIQNGNGSFYPPHDTIGPGDGEPRPRDAGDLVLRRRP